MDQESGGGLARSSGSGLSRGCYRDVAGAAVIFWGRIHFQVHSLGVDRDQFLIGWWAEDLSSSLAVAWSSQFLVT